MLRLRALLGSFLLMAVLAGCALFVRPLDAADDDAHVVFLTSPECPYVVVKTQGDSFAILRPLQLTSPVRGDMFVGALRPGTGWLFFVPFPEQDLGPPVSVDVHAAGLVLADAQSLWRELCPIP